MTQATQAAVVTGLTVPANGERAGMSKLTEDQVREIYRRAWAGEVERSIGADYGVSHSAVHQIKHRRSWAHVDHHQVMAS